MSTWNLGADDVSDETRIFKDKLASKDGQIAAQQDRLAKQATDLDELQERLNEALHKLTSETRRALQLEDDLQQRSEDLRNEKIASENVKATLHGALDKNKGNSMEMRDLEATLERISHTSDQHKAHSAKLEKDKFTLEARVRELEANLQALSPPPTTTPGRRAMVSRPRSSSLSNFRITTLEQDLSEVRGQLAKKESELVAISQKFTQVHKDLIKADNEKLASERKWNNQVEALKASLEEKEEELTFLRDQGGDGGREDELLKRIEEDDAKIAALELMARGVEDSKQTRDKARRTEVLLKEEQKRRAEVEERYTELVREKEEILDDLDDARREMQRLAKQLQQRDLRDEELKAKAVKSLNTCEDPLMGDDSCLIDMDTLEPQTLSYNLTTTPSISPRMDTDSDTISHIEKLLVAIDRLRGERNSLRRDVQFLESESRFAIEALEAKLSASISTASNETVASLGQMKSEMDDLHAQLARTREQSTAALHVKNFEIRRLGLHVHGLAIVLNHVASYTDSSPSPSLEIELRASQASVQDNQDVVKDLEERYDVTLLCLEAITSQRDDLLTQLEEKDSQREKELEPLRLAEQDARQQLDEVVNQVAELNAHIDDIESERDSLTLQVTNLITDLQSMQHELTSAESRYTNLQFHQLSTMTSNEATRTLRDHIEELEGRVMRRTEQIGIHQHDIRRLETNLRLQEERLNEMTTELEMLAAQKDAMVEDCADAREARDEALAHVEALEEDIEANSENGGLVMSMIAVVADTVSSAREAIRHSKNEASRAKKDCSTMDTNQVALTRQLEDKTTALGTLTQLSGQYREELEKAKKVIEERETEVKDTKASMDLLHLEKTNLEVQLAILRAQDHDTTIRELERQKEELEKEREQIGVFIDKDSEKKLVELEQQHTEAITVLEARLIERENSLEKLQAHSKTVEDDHQIALEGATASIRELEQRLETTTKDLEELRAIHRQSDALDKERTKKLSELQEQLKVISQDHQDALHSRDSLKEENVRIVNDLERTKSEQDTLLTRSRDEHIIIQRDLEKKVQTLQGRFEEDARLLDISKEEAARLSLRLQEETQGRAEDQRESTLALTTANKRSEHLTERISETEAELDRVRDSLRQAEEQLKAVDEERTALQQDLTTFEAEVQKSKSLVRYLEMQVKDSEQIVSSLRGDIEHIQAELARSEKACKAAEVNSSLQNAQHKRETSELQRELSALKSRTNLEDALAELEERNNEMEELLRAKCTEIEENDDRVLEMLKEKKKLTTKVDSLTRKVQSLQAKLAAAKASGPVQRSSPEPAIAPPQSLPSIAQTTPPAVDFPMARPRSVTVASVSPVTGPSFATTPPLSAGRRPVQRVVSGPSSLPRSKTPERSRTTVPVFKARTPERQMLPDVDPMPSAVVIGKKRAAPDDFEACENLPARAFSAEGEDVENRTPRVRRVLNSLQSGFTPVRNQNRPTAPMPSPRRAVPSSSGPYISDMTNSPFSLPPMPTSSAKASNKRSWLGKIRGSSQVPERPSGMRSFFGGEAP